MSAVLIRDLPSEVVTALKRRAARNHRSLQGELRQILAGAAQEQAPPDPLPPLELRFSTAVPRSNWSREEVYDDDGR